MNHTPYTDQDQYSYTKWNNFYHIQGDTKLFAWAQPSNNWSAIHPPVSKASSINWKQNLGILWKHSLKQEEKFSQLFSWEVDKRKWDTSYNKEWNQLVCLAKWTGCCFVEICCSDCLVIRKMTHHSTHLYTQFFWTHNKEANLLGSNTRTLEMKFSQERCFHLCQF